MRRRIVIVTIAAAAFIACAALGIAAGLAFAVTVAEGCDHYEDYPFTPWLGLGFGIFGAIASGWITSRRPGFGTARPASS